MKIVFEQLSLLFIFMLCGFLLGKSKLINYEHTRILSVLEIYLFLPCTVFNAFYSNFTIDNLTKYYQLVIVSTAVLSVLVFFSHIISVLLSKDPYDKKVYKYSLTIPNYGYMGYALALGLYGTEGLLNIILFAIPFSIYTYTFGYCMLTNQRVSLKKLINPVILSILAGAVFGLLNVKLPGIVETFLNKSGNCMAPVSMLLAGITIAEFNIKHLISEKSVYIASVIRLVLIPCLVMAALKPFFDDTLVRAAVLLCAMPCGLNTIVFPKLIGEDCKTGAKLAFVSNLFAMLSIPVVLSFL